MLATEPFPLPNQSIYANFSYISISASYFLLLTPI
jgi:hypothetical protein